MRAGARCTIGAGRGIRALMTRASATWPQSASARKRATDRIGMMWICIFVPVPKVDLGTPGLSYSPNRMSVTYDLGSISRAQYSPFTRATTLRHLPHSHPLAISSFIARHTHRLPNRQLDLSAVSVPRSSCASLVQPRARTSVPPTLAPPRVLGRTRPRRSAYAGVAAPSPRTTLSSSRALALSSVAAPLVSCPAW